MKTLLQITILIMVVSIANGQTQEATNETQTNEDKITQVGVADFENVANLELFPENDANRGDYWESYDRLDIFYLKGNVGIGLDDPQTPLHVIGGILFENLSGTGQRMVVADASGFLSTQQIPGGSNLWQTGSNGAIYYNGGNVGIGTINPGEKLEISGNIKSNNFSTINSSVIAGEWATGGSNSVVIGRAAGYITNGLIAIGAQAGQDVTGENSIVIGRAAGVFNSGHRAIAIGYKANELNTGDDVIALGYEAGKQNTLNNQFIVKQANVNSTPLIQGNFANGYVGIGTSSPQRKFHVSGITRIDGNVELLNAHRFIGTITDHHLYLKTNSSTRLTIRNDGKVGIGTTNPTTELTVNGKILAKEIEVVSQIQSDFVFEMDYELMPLYEVERFVKENKHLPEIPSMHEFAEKGQNLAEMQDLLLRKIEELTLHIINQQKEIDELKELLIAKEE